MSILGTHTKQPGERLDYDVDFSTWFSGRGDTPATHTTTVDSGITLISSIRTGNVIKVTLEGGTSGQKYKVTLRLTTSAGLVREADFYVRVKEA